MYLNPYQMKERSHLSGTFCVPSSISRDFMVWNPNPDFIEISFSTILGRRFFRIVVLSFPSSTKFVDLKCGFLFQVVKKFMENRSY